MKSEELRRLIKQSEKYCDFVSLAAYLRNHAAHFAALIDAAEYFVAEKASDITDRNRYSALYEALQPFAKD